ADLLRDEALVERTPGTLDLGFARAAWRLVEDASVRRRQHGVPELRAHRRRRQVEIPRGGPRRDQVRLPLDRQVQARRDREPVLGVSDREREDVLEPPGAEVAQEQQPATESARHTGGEHARARNELVAERAEALDGPGG